MDVAHEVRHVLPVGRIGFLLLLEFEDGLRLADIGPVVRRGGVFASLENRDAFERVYVDPELGTITWPGELDLDADVLYQKSIPVPENLFAKFVAAAAEVAGA